MIPIRRSSESSLRDTEINSSSRYLLLGNFTKGGELVKGKACKHGGVCMNEDIYPFEMYCDCTGTGYHGDLCEIDDCINCNGNQTCTEVDLLVPNNATCECKGLFFTM